MGQGPVDRLWKSFLNPENVLAAEALNQHSWRKVKASLQADVNVSVEEGELRHCRAAFTYLAVRLQVCTDCQVIRMRPADPARPTDPLTALFVRARVHCQSVGGKAPCHLHMLPIDITSVQISKTRYCTLKWILSQTEGYFLSVKWLRAQKTVLCWKGSWIVSVCGK